MTSIAIVGVCFLQQVRQCTDSNTHPIQQVQGRDSTATIGGVKPAVSLQCQTTTYNWDFFCLAFTLFPVFFWAFGFGLGFVLGLFLFRWKKIYFITKMKNVQQSGDGEMSSFFCRKKEKRTHIHTRIHNTSAWTQLITQSFPRSLVLYPHTRTNKKKSSAFSFRRSSTWTAAKVTFYPGQKKKRPLGLCKNQDTVPIVGYRKSAWLHFGAAAFCATVPISWYCMIRTVFWLYA